MLDREAFRVAVQDYLDAKGKNWTGFARGLGFSREHMSKVFHGKVSLPEGFVYRVIELLAEWKCIQTRDQARALLKLMGTPDYPAENWGAEPLSALRETPYDGKNVSSLGQLQGMHPQQSPMVNLWTVPYHRNPHFTGRDELLEQLDQHFTAARQHHPRQNSTVALTQPQAIRGLGGIGKTQVALEYAYRSRDLDRYGHTFWVNAASEEALLAGFVMLAELLPDFPAKEETDEWKLVEAVKRWLEQCQQRWLLIFDNADDVALVGSYLPKLGNGSIVLTTRAHAVGSLAAPVEVNTMGFLEGTQLLLRRAQREDHASDEEINQAGNIVVALDHFPLALDQAGAYLEETQCSLIDYLDLYQTHRQALLSQRGPSATDYPYSVATTWLLSFEKIQHANPAAAELLHLCSFLAPDRIPEELLRDGAAYWPPLLQKAASDSFAFQQLIAELLKFSLVKRLTEDHALSIHRLVQAVQRDRMEPEVQLRWAECVIRAVNHIFPRDPQDIASWPQCLRYLDQAQTCNALVEHYLFPLATPRSLMRLIKEDAPWRKIISFSNHVKHLLPRTSLSRVTVHKGQSSGREASTFIEAADLLDRTGLYLHNHALYPLAELLCERALAIRLVQLGPEHHDTGTSLHNLAGLYEQQGKYEEAEPLYERALAISERQLGPEHPSTAASLNNLAILYERQGRYEEAEPFYKHALTIRQTQLGETHPETTASLNNLAGLYVMLGRYEEAEPLYQRALVLSEHELGAEHPETAASLNNLANLYVEQGEYEEAEPLYQRALAISERQLGAEHPHTATSLDNLAGLYEQQGRYEEAKPLYERALAIRREKLGDEHPDTATSLNNLAGWYRRQGRYEEAEPLYERALAIQQAKLGNEHPETATGLENLAGLYVEQGRYEEAEPLYDRALAISERQLGPEHPDTAISLNNLAGLYYEQGRYEEAKPLYQRALAIRQTQLGDEHPETAINLSNLANVFEKQGRYEEAEPLYQRALAIFEQELGDEHPETAVSLNNLAGLYESQGRYQEAEPLYQRALAIKQAQLGAEHPSTAVSLNNLADLYESQGRYQEAEPLYERSLRIRQTQLGPEHPDTATGLHNLARLYAKEGRYEEAGPLYQQALRIQEQRLGSEHPLTQKVRKNYAAFLRVTQRSEEAEKREER
jgi:tetratricopeptide (TPR) repeat protein